MVHIQIDYLKSTTSKRRTQILKKKRIIIGSKALKIVEIEDKEVFPVFLFFV